MKLKEVNLPAEMKVEELHPIRDEVVSDFDPFPW